MKNKGFTLLVSIIVTGMLLIVSFAVVNVAVKQLILANSNVESQYAFYNADSGTECAVYWDFKNGTSAFTAPISSTINCAGQSAPTTVSGATTTFTLNFSSPRKGCVTVSVGKHANGLTLIDSRGYNSCSAGFTRKLERGQTLNYINSNGGTTVSAWFDDSSSASYVSATKAIYGGDTWNWVSSGITTPNSGTEYHQSAIVPSDVHQHYFYDSSSPLSVNIGDTLFAYVYLDPANPPTQVELQWFANDITGWEHRAFWNNTGVTQVNWGTTGTNSLRYMGALPGTGSWVRLSVPASQVGLEGRTVTGMAFTLYGGRAAWDSAGK